MLKVTPMKTLLQVASNDAANPSNIVLNPVADANSENSLFRTDGPSANSGSITIVSPSASNAAKFAVGSIWEIHLHNRHSQALPPVGNLLAIAGKFGRTDGNPASGTLQSQNAVGPVTFSIVSQPTNGSVILTNTSTGAFTYTPSLGFNGSDSFSFQVADASGNVSNVAVETAMAG